MDGHALLLSCALLMGVRAGGRGKARECARRDPSSAADMGGPCCLGEEWGTFTFFADACIGTAIAHVQQHGGGHRGEGLERGLRGLWTLGGAGVDLHDGLVDGVRDRVGG